MSKNRNNRVTESTPTAKPTVVYSPVEQPGKRYQMEVKLRFGGWYGPGAASYDTLARAKEHADTHKRIFPESEVRVVDRGEQ